MSANPRPLRVGTRGSRLALAQTSTVIDLLSARAAEVGEKRGFEVVEIRTTGDRDRTRPLSEFPARGVFAHELQRALREGQVDLAVHSLKDLPAPEPEDLAIAAVPQRGEVRDVLVGSGLDELAPGASVGTSSSRREALVRRARPDLVVAPLRGNVDTRVRRVEEGAIDAAILAGAGLERIGRADVIAERLDPAVFVPPPGQGALAIEVAAARFDGDLGWLAGVDDPASAAAVRIERAFAATVEAGCTLPVGAYAAPSAGGMFLRGIVLSPDGKRWLEGTEEGAEGVEVGRRLGLRLLSQGAADLIAGRG